MLMEYVAAQIIQAGCYDYLWWQIMQGKQIVKFGDVQLLCLICRAPIDSHSRRQLVLLPEKPANKGIQQCFGEHVSQIHQFTTYVAICLTVLFWPS